MVKDSSTEDAVVLISTAMVPERLTCGTARLIAPVIRPAKPAELSTTRAVPPVRVATPSRSSETSVAAIRSMARVASGTPEAVSGVTRSIETLPLIT